MGSCESELADEPPVTVATSEDIQDNVTVSEDLSPTTLEDKIFDFVDSEKPPFVKIIMTHDTTPSRDIAEENVNKRQANAKVDLLKNCWERPTDFKDFLWQFKHFKNCTFYTPFCVVRVNLPGASYENCVFKKVQILSTMMSCNTQHGTPSFNTCRFYDKCDIVHGSSEELSAIDFHGCTLENMDHFMFPANLSGCTLDKATIDTMSDAKKQKSIDMNNNKVWYCGHLFPWNAEVKDYLEEQSDPSRITGTLFTDRRRRLIDASETSVTIGIISGVLLLSAFLGYRLFRRFRLPRKAEQDTEADEMC